MEVVTFMGLTEEVADAQGKFDFHHLILGGEVGAGGREIEGADLVGKVGAGGGAFPLQLGGDFWAGGFLGGGSLGESLLDGAATGGRFNLLCGFQPRRAGAAAGLR